MTEAWKLRLGISSGEIDIEALASSLQTMADISVRKVPIPADLRNALDRPT